MFFGGSFTFVGLSFVFQEQRRKVRWKVLSSNHFSVMNLLENCTVLPGKPLSLSFLESRA